MTQSLARASRDHPLLPPGATLARLLAALDGAPVAASAETSAERLGRWFEWRDAIALSEVLNAAAAAVSDAPGADPVALSQEARRLHARLDALTRDPVTARTRRAPPRSTLEPASATTVETPPDLPALRQRHLAAQREIAAGIADLRQRLRDALAAVSPALARLAALDAVMERVVGEREHLLLGSVGQRLSADAGRRDLQTLLRAELDLRWQPVQALLEALST